MAYEIEGELRDWHEGVDLENRILLLKLASVREYDFLVDILEHQHLPRVRIIVEVLED